jgi:hypothetical protein
MKKGLKESHPTNRRVVRSVSASAGAMLVVSFFSMQKA